MSANRRTWRRTIGLLGAVLLAVLLGACGANSSTTQPRATINFLIRNSTPRSATYRFTGSASVLPATGPVECLSAIRIGATWDPTWTLEINSKKVVASTDGSDLQLGADPKASLTVIVMIDAGGVRMTDVHPGAPAVGEVASPGPSACPLP